MATVTMQVLFNGQIEVKWAGIGRDFSRVFTIPSCGGYVRDEAGAQVCYGLTLTGQAMRADTRAEFVAMMRAEMVEEAAKCGAEFVELDPA